MIHSYQQVEQRHPVSRSNRLYYDHHHHCCCCSDFHFVLFVFFVVVVVAGYRFTALKMLLFLLAFPSSTTLMPTKWAGLSLRQNKDPLRVCCCCIGIEVFEIGLSLVLRLRLHLLLYYKVQQKFEMDELVSNIHPVS